MTRKQFDKSVLKLFTPVLAPLGFSPAESRHCTFYRKMNDVYHFVVPDLGSRGAWYDIKVFPASPALDPLFHEQFPDEVGIPSGSFSCLSERGVGLAQAQFNCKTEDNLVGRFERTVRELLVTKAVPYLDQFTTLEDMIRVIKHPIFLGIALHAIGRLDEARPILEEQRDRLSASGSSERAVTARLQRINELLQPA